MIATLVAITNGINKLIKFKDNWINYRNIYETLRKEPYLMEAELGDYSDCDDKYKLFVDRVESLISREHSLWVTTTSCKDKSHKKK